MSIIVDIIARFNTKFKQFGKTEKKKIISFINAFQSGDFQAIDNFKIDNYTVRNKPSTDVPVDDPQFFSKVSLAKKHKLWAFMPVFMIWLVT